MRFSQKLRIQYKLYNSHNILHLYLLRSNLLRFLEINIIHTKIRKLKKLEIQKGSEFGDLGLDLNYVIYLIISIMKAKILSKPIGLEHPSVKRVIEIAEDIMSKNKLLNVETLYHIAKKRLKLPRNGLLFIIQFLLNKKILIEGSKFSKETVLFNYTRRKIYDYIKRNPGVHFSILRKKTLPEESESSGQLIWHIEMLLKFNYINKIKVGNYTVFIPFDMSEDMGKILFLMRDQITYKIIHLLVRKEPLVKSEIYKEIEEKREDVYYRINNLLNYDVIALSESSEKEICINSRNKALIKDIFKMIKRSIVRK